MSNAVTVTTNTHPIDRFLLLVQQGIDAWVDAAALAREELRKDPEWADKVAEKNPMITSAFIRRFANIGVKYIPQLVVSDCPGAKRLRTLPLPVQEQCYRNPVPLLIQTADGGWDELQADLHNLTPDQAAQVFAPDHVRTAAEQRAWIEDKRAKDAAPQVVSLPYRVVGKRLVVMEACQLTSKELAMILAELQG